jgi:hypothetical protein
MKSFGSISPQDYTISTIDASAPIMWRLESSSFGMRVIDPLDLEDAVTITRATNNRSEFFNRDIDAPVNIETGVYEYVLYSSVKQQFYTNNNLFISESTPVTESIAGLSDNSYVVSIGQEFYGNSIKRGSFELYLGDELPVIRDDSYGNLIVSDLESVFYVGNIFYDQGIAVIAHDTDSVNSNISVAGMKIVNGTVATIKYDTQYKIYRHEISVRLSPADFNFSIANPSVRRTFDANEQNENLFTEQNIPTDADGSYKVYRLMQAGVIKPYVTTIGLYSERKELLAVAKLSTPIQRTFDTNQIFIVRFDV